MELHRADKQPEWTTVAHEERNLFQRVAASTNGFITPANAITVLGLLIVFFGLQQIINEHYWIGAIALIIGRLLDIVDGLVADKTGTKGPLGELMDAGADKIGTFATVAAFFYAHVAAYSLLTIVVAPQLIIAAIVTVVTIQKRRFHPSLIGKLSMAVAWFALVGFVALQALDNPSFLAAIVNGVAVLSGLMALYATIGYVKDAWFRSAAA